MNIEGPRFTVDSFKTREEAEQHIANMFEREVVIEGFSDNAVSEATALKTLHAIWGCPLFDKAHDFKDFPDAQLRIVFDPERRADFVAVSANAKEIVITVPTRASVETEYITGAVRMYSGAGVSGQEHKNTIRANYGLPPEGEKPAPGIRFNENE